MIRSRRASSATRVLAILALAPALGGPQLIQRNQPLARHVGITGFLVACSVTWLLASLDAVLARCRAAERLALVGPTVGCFADDLFARGIDVVAGTAIADGAGACARLAAGETLGNFARRTVMTAADYPGFDALMARL